MADLDECRSLIAEVGRTGVCSHPIRLRPEGPPRPGGPLLVACKDRRAELCPACAHTYKGDAWHVISAGLAGGKGISPSVADHPTLFVTLTAPSFGPVHAHRRQTGGDLTCRPRRRHLACPHGLPQWCDETHAPDTEVVGRPLCPDCFDYAGAVLWNASVGLLWTRTSVAVGRSLATRAGVSRRALRGVCRISYVKVAEFQRRGLVHLHLVCRADGPAGPDQLPPAWLSAGQLDDAVRTAVARVTVAEPPAPGRTPQPVRWGTQLDVAEVRTTDRPAQQVAAYVAKYATKTAGDTPALAHRIRSVADLAARELDDHDRRLVAAAWALGGEPGLADLRLRAHAHTFGFRGHVISKSVRYSTTFAALRSARAEHTAGGRADEPIRYEYEGRGYDDPRAGRFAYLLAQAATKKPR